MNNVKIENAKLLESLNKIDDEDEVRKIIFKAIKSGAKKLQKGTQTVFKRKMPTANERMIKGVKVRNDAAYMESKVHIMGDHRNKWFEKGTEKRYIQNYQHSNFQRKIHNKNTGKSNYRGHIKGIGFFEEAQTLYAKDIQSAMDNVIEKELNKL